ncbi:universal stress protein [Kibdelosporangium philippinense]|uniref:universal stress protein n=1 Tax=Kibdelosporangium philippinense TaxID=211113 RepID=UPI0036159087
MATVFDHHRPIIVGIDGSAAALAAVRWAAREASARKLPLTLVHVQPGPSRYHDAKVAAAMRPVLREQAKKWLHEALDAACAEVPDLNPTIELRDAEVVAALLEMSADAAMVVLGARGTGGSPACWWGRPRLPWSQPPLARSRSSAHPNWARRRQAVRSWLVSTGPRRARRRSSSPSRKPRCVVPR